MVSKKEQVAYEQVLERDRLMTWLSGLVHTFRGLDAWLATDPEICMAPVIDRSLSDHCSGAMERDHVHSHTGGTKGKRAPTTIDNLVILCHHHHQDGWATAHRPQIREYIKEANERYRDLAGRPAS